MALKKQIDKASFEKLSKDFQNEYKQDGDLYVLDVEGDEDASAAVRAKNHEKKARQEAEAKLKEAQTELERLQKEQEDMLKGVVPKGDVDKLEKSYQEKLSKREKELGEQVRGLETNLNTMLVDNVANSLASKISNSPEILLPHIKTRLRAEYKDGKAQTRVLDKDGNASALTVEDLEKEFLANKTFAAIVTGSKASGAGSNGGGRGSSAPQKVDFTKSSPKDIAAALRASGKVSTE